MADIVLVNPRFEVSFWGMEYALALTGKRANLPVACLPLLAAITPKEHTVTLIDENVEPIDWERCRRADIVGITGMSVQRFRMKEILAELKDRGCFCVVGGPWVTVRLPASTRVKLTLRLAMRARRPSYASPFDTGPAG